MVGTLGPVLIKRGIIFYFYYSGSVHLDIEDILVVLRPFLVYNVLLFYVFQETGIVKRTILDMVNLHSVLLLQ